MEPSSPHDVFLSYAREDGEFAAELSGHLGAAGVRPWVDVKGIYGGEEFWPEICKAIDAAAAVVYVISAHSAASPYCRREVDRAVAGRKRIVPVCRQEVDEDPLHAEVARRQWIFFRNDEDGIGAVPALVTAIRTDWAWVREHARLLVRAEEWRVAERDRSLTLRGRELRQADHWLARVPAEHAPAPLHLEYIRASHRAARQRALRLGGATAAALAVIALVGRLAVNQHIERLNETAADRLEEGETSRAQDLFARADRLCSWVPAPVDACENVAIHIGAALLDAERYDEAIGRFSRTIDATATAESGPAVDRRAVAYRNRAYGRIMLAETRADEARRNKDYTLALQDVAAADHVEERLDRSKPDDSALVRARVLLGQGAYDQALKEIDFVARQFGTHAASVSLLRALVYHCLGRKDQKWIQDYVDVSGGPSNPAWATNWTYFERISSRCRTEQR